MTPQQVQAQLTQPVGQAALQALQAQQGAQSAVVPPQQRQQGTQAAGMPQQPQQAALKAGGQGALAAVQEEAASQGRQQTRRAMKQVILGCSSTH